MTGPVMDTNSLMKTGERIYNLERYYNKICGFTGTDDTLPKKFLEHPGTGPAKRHVCELDKMKKEYYEPAAGSTESSLKRNYENHR
jgi:aldehyde:ferredoxin oxidoreductase